MSIIITKRQLLTEVFKLLLERNDTYRRAWDEFAQYESEMVYKIVHEVEAGKRNEYWKLIPFGRLKRIWEGYMQFKFIRDVKGMNMIREICLTNIARLYVNTVLVGHTPTYPKEYLENFEYCFKEKEEPKKKEYFKDPNQLKLFKNPETTPEPEPERYDDYCTHIDLTWEQFENRLYTYIGDRTYSDYATQPLVELAYDLIDAKSPEEELLICDRIFNVVHMRGDIAALFVQGGSDALSELSGEHTEPEVYRPME